MLRFLRRSLRAASRLDGLGDAWLVAVGMGAWGCATTPAPALPVVEPPAALAVPEGPAALTLAPSPPILLRDVGFLAPRSALHDPDADVYLVSNSNGGLADADGNGFISRVAPDGAVLALKWIDGASGGLDAPKGMALSPDKLYVADLKVVRSFDRKTGALLGKVAIVSASYLNDVALGSEGMLYVSDTGLGKLKGATELQKTGSDSIYSVDSRGVVGVFAKGAELGQPTGLLAGAQSVWVASLSGESYRMAPDGQRLGGARPAAGGLEGVIETESGRLVVACSETSTIYRSPPGAASAGAAPAKFEPLISDLNAPGDIGYDRQRRQLLVPLVSENALYIQQIPAD
jgi:hypothetical protein